MIKMHALDGEFFATSNGKIFAIQAIAIMAENQTKSTKISACVRGSL